MSSVTKSSDYKVYHVRGGHGGYQGHDYQIDYATKGQPLVRVDVIKREAEAIKSAKSKAWHDTKVAVKQAQGNLA